MALTMPQPTLHAVVQALINAIVAQAAFLNGVLAPYGVTLDTTSTAEASSDNGELENIRFGDRVNPPPGLSILLHPRPVDFLWKTTGAGAEDTLALAVYVMWLDLQDGDNTHILTETPGKLMRMMTDFTEALKVVIGPQNLGASGWAVPSGGTILGPKVTTATPLGFIPFERPEMTKSKEILNYSALLWTGLRYYLASP